MSPPAREIERSEEGRSLVAVAAGKDGMENCHGEGTPPRDLRGRGKSIRTPELAAGGSLVGPSERQSKTKKRGGGREREGERETSSKGRKITRDANPW